MCGVVSNLSNLSNNIQDLQRNLSELVYVAVRYGHRKLAAFLIRAYSTYNFNELHIATLNNDRQPLKVISIGILLCLIYKQAVRSLRDTNACCAKLLKKKINTFGN